ncbi:MULTISPECIES: LacI family DNA-binding transcriptional regulator [Cohaesibacter]|uniref:LacI family DNA-binding transcriptional regulator n=1 Tax=Cohaesibacter TaxID=655352 RepID=UPI000DEA9A70|nr:MULTISPECIES: LacI family DNA-binding transcriptional regulator [Cohaesibacter]TLP49439.1 LacI family transcriptional regulator [Cohaesibacter sp. CAU 1516]
MPRPTLADVARVAGVSRMTASRALNDKPGMSDKTREDIQRIASEMGYVANPMARKLSSGRTHIIGVIAQLHTSFTGEMVMGIGTTIRGAGYEMLVYSLSDNDTQPPSSVVNLLQQVADGIIVLLPYEADYLEKLRDASLPVVTVETVFDEPTFPAVITDGYQGGRQAMTHLIELGHKRIGFITGNLKLLSARSRLKAYQDMVAQYDLDDDPALICEGDYMQLGGYDAAKQLLALENRPTAIFASNDVSAQGAMSAIREGGLSVPDDISLVGFDDIGLCEQMHPTLTTVHQPLQQMGRSAVNMLMAMISGLDVPFNQITLPTELVVRQSTAAPKTNRN